MSTVMMMPMLRQSAYTVIVFIFLWSPRTAEVVAQSPAAEKLAADDTDSQARAKIRDMGGLILQMSDEDQSIDVSFNLRGRSLTDEGLAAVAKLKNVAVLNLRDTKITGASLVHLKGMASLRRLHLERTSLTDAGTEHLASLTNLEYLNLYSTKVTDKTLVHLKGLKNLRKLFVWETGVTDEGVASLAKALPELRIVRGVDLSRIPKSDFKPEPPPKPKVDLKWIATTSRSDAPKSLNGINVQVFFENASGKPVKVFWVSYNDELQLYAELAPGAKKQQNTYSRNTWLITDANDKPMGYFIVGEDLARAVIPK